MFLEQTLLDRLHAQALIENEERDRQLVSLSPHRCAERAAEQCGWNPTDAAPYCDWDRNCPVHGAEKCGAQP
ncbi:MAG TPA: hypothetical protein VFY14_00440 [Streptomyces sp.]|nr:hypothetical protein [Streptomyces sp.]